MKKNDLCKLIFLSLMCMLVCGYGFINLPVLREVVNSSDITYQSWKKNASEIETQLKERMAGRQDLVDLYGVSLRVLGKNMVGNFEFIKDERGIVQMVQNLPENDLFEQSVIALHNRLEQEGTPLIYLGAPNKVDGFQLSEQLYFFGQSLDERVHTLELDGIDVLDAGERMKNSEDAPSPEEFFFHTDVHYSTYGEFWLSKLLVQHLKEVYQIDFPESDFALDVSRFERVKYDFLGNTARSAGQYFVGLDCFENYIPIYETDFTLFNKAREPVRTGNFETVIMNGYENGENNSIYTYWITNYGQYPEPYYRYQNNLNPEGPKLLVIADSTFMRSTAFLSLVSGEVTVLDIRSMGETPYVQQALDEKRYDAVVICATDYWSRSFSVDCELPALPEEPAQTADYWIGTNGICLDSCNGESTGNADSFAIQRDAKQVELVGWAADFKTRQPLSALYLQVGERVIQCGYGIERTSVSDHYQDDNLKNTGFSVTFPAFYLREGAVDQLLFIQVGTDGTYRYEPVRYSVST